MGTKRVQVTVPERIPPLQCSLIPSGNSSSTFHALIFLRIREGHNIWVMQIFLGNTNVVIGSSFPTVSPCLGGGFRFEEFLSLVDSSLFTIFDIDAFPFER